MSWILWSGKMYFRVYIIIAENDSEGRCGLSSCLARLVHLFAKPHEGLVYPSYPLQEWTPISIGTASGRLSSSSFAKPSPLNWECQVLSLLNSERIQISHRLVFFHCNS